MSILQLPLRVSASLELLWITPHNLFVEYKTFQSSLRQLSSQQCAWSASEQQEQCWEAQQPAVSGWQAVHSFLPRALLVITVNAIVYGVSHALLMAHRVLSRHQELMQDRSRARVTFCSPAHTGGGRSRTNTSDGGCSAVSDGRVNSQSALAVRLPPRPGVLQRNNECIAYHPLLIYWCAPLSMTEAQEAQEVRAYTWLADMAGITPVLLPVFCGGVVLYTAGSYVAQATSGMQDGQDPSFSATWVMITAVAAALLARVDGVGMLRSFREQQRLREQAQVWDPVGTAVYANMCWSTLARARCQCSYHLSIMMCMCDCKACCRRPWIP